MPKITVGPRVNEKAAEWLASKFGNRNAGATLCLESFPDLVETTLNELKGKLEKNELGMILDVEGDGLQFVLSGSLPSVIAIKANVYSAFQLYPGSYEERWKVEKDVLNQKLSALSFFQEFCLKLWCCWFHDDKNSNFETYAATLLFPGQEGYIPPALPKSKIK